MKLRKIEFKNYKSISHGELDIENDITCLVGINESGKSNVLLGLEKAGTNKELTKTEYSRHKVNDRKVGNSPELKLCFEPTKKEQEEIKSILGHDDVSTIIFAKTRNRYRLGHPGFNYKNSNFAARVSEVIKDIIVEEIVEAKGSLEGVNKGRGIEEEKFAKKIAKSITGIIRKEEATEKMVEEVIALTTVNIRVEGILRVCSAIFAQKVRELRIERGIEEAGALKELPPTFLKKEEGITEETEVEEVERVYTKELTKNTAKRIRKEVFEDIALKKKAYRDEVTEELEKYIPQFLYFDSVAFDEYFLPPNGEAKISELIDNPDKNRSVKNLLALGGVFNPDDILAADGNESVARDKLLADASITINEIIGGFWSIESVKIELSAVNNTLKICFKEKDKISPFIPRERSIGLQWALAFNIYFLAETKNNLKESVLLIDEPGIFLHIDAQNKLLKQTFKKIVDAGNQIIYTTHLPYLIDSRFPERIRTLEKKDESTVIGNKAWLDGEFGKIPEPVKTALGLRWSDHFKLAEKNALVEGPSDQIILTQLHSIFGKDKEINFLPAYGHTRFPPVLANIKVEDKLYFGIVDGDVKDKRMEELRGDCALVSIKDDEVQSIPKLTKNEDIISIEDVVPEDIFRETVFQVYKPKFIRHKNGPLTLDELPKGFSRVEKFKGFFAKKLGADKHKLKKMDIARAIADILKRKDQNKDKEWKKDKEWNTSKVLIETIEKRLVRKVRKSKDSD